MNAIHQFNLDFDDAYQYVAAKRMGINLVTFDQDFQKTDIEPISPGKAAEQNLPNQ